MVLTRLLKNLLKSLYSNKFLFFTILSLAPFNLVAKSFTLNSKRIADISNVAIPAAAVLIPAYKDDHEGGKQAFISLLLVHGTVLSLKHSVKVQRPDGSNNRSVISGHTALAFMGAAYLEERYGLYYSAVPYALATFTGYSRVNSKKHRWSEVISGAVLGQLTSYAITTPYKDKYANYGWIFDIKPEVFPYGSKKDSKLKLRLGLCFHLSFR
jgi:membrane-associated phospholipid phosphatase